MSDVEIYYAYKTIMFGLPLPGVDNAIVMHDRTLAVCIGIARSFHGKNGYGWGQCCACVHYASCAT